MAITFPRPLPDSGFSECGLRIQRFMSQAQSGGRLTNVVEYADPLWLVDITSHPVPIDDFRALEGWWDSLRGGLRSVLFRHPAYVAPKLNMAARGPETTPGTVASITSGNVVTVTGVAAGLALSNQDLVSFSQGALRAVGRVVDVSGTGTTRTIEIEPPLPSSFAAGAVARFDRVELLMRPVWSSFQHQRNSILHLATFQLMETRA